MPAKSGYPKGMLRSISLWTAIAFTVALTPLAAHADAGFDKWVAAQWPAAQKLGVSRATVYRYLTASAALTV